jgi:hypothetical protein
LFKPCATRAAGTTPALDWRSLAGDKVRDEHVFIVCRYGRMFLSTSGDCGRRDCGFTTAATGLERGANVWLMPTGQLRGESWKQMLRRWREGGFIR